MTHSRPFPQSTKTLNSDELRRISLLQVLHDYGLMDQMIERESRASGLSPFGDGGVLRADLTLNVWSGSRGRPVVDGRPVSGDVVGFVQAIEGVSCERALEILHERFVLGIRRQASSVLGGETNLPLAHELDGLVADVPYLRRLGVPPQVAETWGVGWCPGGPMQGRIVFPARRPDGTLVGYAGLDPTLSAPHEPWRFTPGFRPELEVFGIARIHQDERVKKAAFEHGLTLAHSPLEVLRMAQQMSLPVVSTMGPHLSRAQIELLLDPRINPMSRVSSTAWTSAHHGQLNNSDGSSGSRTQS